MRNVLPAYAIVRVDRYMASEQDRVTVKRVVWDLELAESEVRRLNDLNADKDAFYFWQYPRVDRPDAASGDRV